VDEQAEPGDAGQAETWQGEDGRTYCRHSDGTTGLIVGGGAGALIGNGIDGGRRRGTGTIIGGIIGAVVGTAIERSANEQSCR
jgi:outer membrane lipoprotein SlyB